MNVKQIRSDEIKRVEYLLVAPFRNCALFVLPFLPCVLCPCFSGIYLIISFALSSNHDQHCCVQKVLHTSLSSSSLFFFFFSRVPSGYFHRNNGGLVFIRPLCTLRSFSLVLPLSLVLACALQVFAFRPLFLPFSIILEILRSPGMIL